MTGSRSHWQYQEVSQEVLNPESSARCECIRSPQMQTRQVPSLDALNYQLTPCWHFKAGFGTTVTPHKAQLLRQIPSCTLQPSWEPAEIKTPFHAGFIAAWEMNFCLGSLAAAFAASYNSSSSTFWTYTVLFFQQLHSCTITQMNPDHAAIIQSHSSQPSEQQGNISVSQPYPRPQDSPSQLIYQSKSQLHWVRHQTRCLQSGRTPPGRAKMKLLENSSWERTNGISLSLQKLIQTVPYHRN